MGVRIVVLEPIRFALASLPLMIMEHKHLAYLKTA